MPKQTHAFHTAEPVTQTLRLAGLVIAGACLFASVAPAQSLEQRISQLLDSPPYNHQFWGVALVDSSGRLLYGRNAERLFIPASNTKLVVSAVAAALLPPDWTVKTSIFGDGPVVDGVLKGDLVLYGRGDPTFSRRCYTVDTTVAGSCDQNPMQGMAELAGQLKAAGIRTVAGNIVGDGSYFGPELIHPAWEAYDLNWWYAAPVSALGFNDNSLDISWKPGATEGAPAEISFYPDFGNVVLVNRTRTVGSDGRTTIDFFREPGTLRVRAVGDVRLGSNGGTEYLALPDPNFFAAAALRQALRDSGIAVLGRTGSTIDSTRYDHLRDQPPLAELESRPLKDWIFPVLNSSQNWFAEMLLKQLGRQFGEAGTWDEGLEVERRFLIDSVGIDSTQFSLRDGSGLASTNLVSPLAFTQLLAYMRRHPRWETFSAGLPRSGSRGSLRTRFVDTPLSGRVVAKTGSISRVHTLSGYIEMPDGTVRTFSVQANHHLQSGRDILEQIDRIVTEMGRQ